MSNELLVLVVFFAVILITLVFLLKQKESTSRDEFQRNREEVNQLLGRNREEVTSSFESLEKKIDERLRERFNDFGQKQYQLNEASTSRIKDIKEDIEKQLKLIREDNRRQLTEIRKTVDEKLQTTLEKRLGASFKQVSERLELVHKGLGEMQHIASGVVDLKNVLSNVKTRGILGEIQLENILEQILTLDQYEKNIATIPGSKNFVEFAIKYPGKNKSEKVLMPIDSKFPISSYQNLVDAYEGGNQKAIETARKELVKTIISFGKDISDKYIESPFTTDFGIMFLPIESLYAEVLRHPGLFEDLQRNYNVAVTGPATLAAFLNSLQMGFRTLAVEKKSSIVWKTLQEIKTEFSKFTSQLDKVDDNLNKASKSLNDLRETRTNVMSRKLKKITLEDSQKEEKIQLDAFSQEKE